MEEIKGRGRRVGEGSRGGKEEGQTSFVTSKLPF